jgi:cytochrome c-type biogenesis protein CcmH
MVTDGAQKAASGIPGPTGDEMKAAAGLPKGQQEAMVRGMVDGLEAKLAQNPGNPDGWIMLMRSRMQLGEPGKAGKALQDGLAAFRNDQAASRRLREAAATWPFPAPDRRRRSSPSGPSFPAPVENPRDSPRLRRLREINL